MLLADLSAGCVNIMSACLTVWKAINVFVSQIGSPAATAHISVPCAIDCVRAEPKVLAHNNSFNQFFVVNAAAVAATADPVWALFNFWFWKWQATSLADCPLSSTTMDKTRNSCSNGEQRNKILEIFHSHHEQQWILCPNSSSNVFYLFIRWLAFVVVDLTVCSLVPFNMWRCEIFLRARGFFVCELVSASAAVSVWCYCC